MSKPEETLAKAVANLEEVTVMAKARVASYTRNDGTFVKEHDDGRAAAAPKPAGGYDHPNVVGHVSNHKVIGDGGRGEKAGNGDPTHVLTTGFNFAGRTYRPTGKKGNSLHDKTPVHEFEHEKSGHRVWADGMGRVHADSTSEVSSLRAEHEAHQAKGKKRAVSKPLHHSDLKEGDELVGPDGQKHEYLSTHRGLGRMQIETRAGYKHPTEKDGTLPGWKKTGSNNA